VPGWFATDQTAAPHEDQEWLASLCDRLPLKRPGRTEELDGLLRFLVPQASSDVTGPTPLVDGGMSAGATRAMRSPKERIDSQ
jgi:NAD(P)-dependent dehydrogenase (short-subunit alcohol dehydrogenase family)